MKNKYKKIVLVKRWQTLPLPLPLPLHNPREASQTRWFLSLALLV
jgi:hypothetical protein